MKHRQRSLLCILMLLALCSHYLRIHPALPSLAKPQAALSDSESKLALRCPIRLSDLSLDQLEFFPGVSATRAKAVYELRDGNDQDKKALFKALIRIKGIGKKTAKGIVSTLQGDGESPYCSSDSKQRPAVELLEFKP